MHPYVIAFTPIGYSMIICTEDNISVKNIILMLRVVAEK